ncbi:hypothetical protein THASP1DRAFT_28789 [Thamnocephalis sphaerospora]|uniref:Coiled-coil SMC6 And NSE5 INteracting (CANIN) domain-containing protein n=1 Tax=Thamnocephalis sphaerospora TaxID=78915 RepID=A0A4P9XTC3_9FUNG|nr:hypothetical protein THASP1DRAFT_28789 [Thamnocephalis sphaerospora]|eukprot:RKP09415.1 hypothetical protein THASP1DRAFT_28789 [Thamnocephalis sphaerospora]
MSSGTPRSRKRSAPAGVPAITSYFKRVNTEGTSSKPAKGGERPITDFFAQVNAENASQSPGESKLQSPRTNVSVYIDKRPDPLLRAEYMAAAQSSASTRATASGNSSSKKDAAALSIDAESHAPSNDSLFIQSIAVLSSDEEETRTNDLHEQRTMPTSLPSDSSDNDSDDDDLHNDIIAVLERNTPSSTPKSAAKAESRKAGHNLRARQPISYKIDMTEMTFEESDDQQEESYTFSLSNLLTDKARRATVRREATLGVDRQLKERNLYDNDGNDSDAMDKDTADHEHVVCTSDPRVNKLLMDDANIFNEDQFFFFFGESLKLEQSDKARAFLEFSTGDISDQSTEALTALMGGQAIPYEALRSGALAQLMHAGWRLPKDLSVWLFYVACFDANQMTAWQAGALLRHTARTRSCAWLPDNALEQVLRVYTVPPEYLDPQFVLTVDRLSTASKSDIPVNNLTCLLAILAQSAASICRQNIRRHIVLLCLMSLDPRTKPIHARIDACLCALLDILARDGDATVDQMHLLADELFTTFRPCTRTFTTVLDRIPTTVPAYVQLRSRTAVRVLADRLMHPWPVTHDQETFLSALQKLLASRSMQMATKSNFAELPLTLRLVDMALWEEDVRCADKAVVEAVLQQLQFLHGGIVDHPAMLLERSKAKDMLQRLCARIRYATQPRSSASVAARPQTSLFGFLTLSSAPP